MIDQARKFVEITTEHERKRFFWLLASFVFLGIFEVVGIASVLPFMQLVSRPETIHENAWLNWAFTEFGFTNERSFLIASGVTVLVLIAVANGSNIVVGWFQFSFVWSTVHGLAHRLLSTYLHQPYEFFLQKNSSDLTHRVLAEVDIFASAVLLPLVQLIARLFVSLVILALLLVVDPWLGTVVTLVLAAAYAAIFLPVKGYLARIGTKRFEANRMRFRTAADAVGNIKVVKTRGCEDFFLKRFVRSSARYTRIQPKFGVISTTPRYLVQMVAFGTVIGIVLYFLAQNREVQDIVPVLSLYALAGYRLTPSLSQVFKSITSLRFNVPVVEELAADLALGADHDGSTDGQESLDVTEAVTVKNLSFRYPGTEDLVLRGVDLSIPRLATVGFVGSTGSGKTTLVDCIVGLLRPTGGGVFVDGERIGPSNAKKWIRSVGYVPQNVELYDDTILRNIALGAEDSEVDRERVQLVLSVANLSQFVESVPDGLDAQVGEGGVKLSGGQKQRIGLARALYHEPAVLVLDEATSALDGITEDAVMLAISRMGTEITTIMIAHRISTVKNCDRIYILSQGQIAEEGTYDQLLAESELFRDLAQHVA